MTLKSLAHAMSLYKEFIYTTQPLKTADLILNQTLISFTYYLFRAWEGPFSQTRKLTPAEIGFAMKFMETFPLLKLKDAVSVQKEVFEQLKATSYQRARYGGRLKKFLAWMKEQDWWTYPETPPPLNNYATRFNHGYHGVGSKKVSGRTLLPPYRLKEDETPPKLQQQLDALYAFLTESYYPQRNNPPIKPKVAKIQLTSIRRLLGWFYRYARPVMDEGGTVLFYSDNPDIPLLATEKLDFDFLVPLVPIKTAIAKLEARIQADQVAEHFDLWLCKYLDFLEVERRNCPKSLFSVLPGLHALIRFQYRTETEDQRYRDVPAMQKLRNRMCELDAAQKVQSLTSDESMKWLDLPDVWQRIVTPLRTECAYRTSTGHKRPQQAIAHSFQVFVLWGCLTFRPPRRQQEFRELKLSNTCPINRPPNLPSSQLLHPLPEDRAVDKYHGYLHKAEDGVWYMDMTPESYKTGKTYGYQSLKIPNERLADGKSFYDYLEAYLYGYYRDDKGNWRSGGEFAETPAEKGCWYSLRMALSPTVNYVFIQPRKGGPFNVSQFSKIVRASANRLTGQRLSPQLLRAIFATWFLDQGHTPERIESLAYAMGHSLRELKKIYDRRHSQQKNRPIEEAIAQLFPNALFKLDY